MQSLFTSDENALLFLIYPDQMLNLDVVLAQRKMRLNELAEQVGITPQNLSVLKTGRARAIRFSTLEAICKALHCQPGDLFAYDDNTKASIVPAELQSLD